MKRILTFVLLAMSAVALRADVTINLGFGNVYENAADGGMLAPEGSLLQLIVSPGNSIFGDPTPESFVSDDDIVLGSLFINQGAGAFLEPITFTLTGGVTAGDQILLRWYPTLDVNDLGTGPGAGTHYGQFRTDLVETNYGSDTAWVVPAEGATINLNFLTADNGGTDGGPGHGDHPESEGIANLTVIPEPSTYALVGLALAALGFARRRRQNFA